MRAFLRDAWDRFLLYLPLVCMGLLALGSYWMVRSTAPSTEAAPPQTKRHGPDYFMEGFAVRTFDPQGRIRTEVLGRKAQHFPDAQWLEIDAITIRSVDEKGRLTTATALRGLTNEDGSEVQLLGNAVIVREGDASSQKSSNPRLEYRGEFLHAFLDTERIRSHKPVELLRGKDRFTADSLDFDNLAQVITLQGRVRGTLVPESRK
jgi:lipopolysaccharide export system protein LptC